MRRPHERPTGRRARTARRLAAVIVAATTALGVTAAGVPAVVPTAVPAQAAHRTWRVGPHRALTTPSAAAAVAHDGDTVLIDASPTSDIVIRESRFSRNGAGDGYSHNLYVGAVRSLTVTGSYLGQADAGHELKSRAARNTIDGNLITDGDATASYSIDLPNGGRSLVAGNVVIQGPNSENSALVSYGEEGLSNASHLLWVVNNTFVDRRHAGTFVQLARGSRADLRNNLLVGPGDLTNLAGTRARADRRVGPGSFVRPAADDFRLRAGSPAIDRGVRVPRRWRARWEYVAPTRQAGRPVVGRVDLGAYERRGSAA